MDGDERERMQPPGEPGLVEQAAQETKRIDEEPEDEESSGAEEAGSDDEPSPDSPLAADEPADQDIGEQS